MPNIDDSYFGFHARASGHLETSAKHLLPDFRLRDGPRHQNDSLFIGFR